MSIPISKQQAADAMVDVEQLASVRGDFAFYRWRDVAINVWTAQPSVPMVARLNQLTELSTQTHPGGISSVHWLVEGVGLPSGATRAALRALAMRYEDHIQAVGVVLDGGGFWASALRSAINGIVGSTDTALVPRLYSNVDTLVDWLEGAHQRGTGNTIRARELRTKILACVYTTVGEPYSTGTPG